jgi:hypothetical protein
MAARLNYDGAFDAEMVMKGGQRFLGRIFGSVSAVWSIGKGSTRPEHVAMCVAGSDR